MDCISACVGGSETVKFRAVVLEQLHAAFSETRKVLSGMKNVLREAIPVFTEMVLVFREATKVFTEAVLVFTELKTVFREMTSGNTLFVKSPTKRGI